MILNHYGIEQKVIKLNLIYIKNNKTKYIQDFENDLIKRMKQLIRASLKLQNHINGFGVLARLLLVA